jgi:hypothetical protein
MYTCRTVHLHVHVRVVVAAIDAVVVAAAVEIVVVLVVRRQEFLVDSKHVIQTAHRTVRFCANRKPKGSFAFWYHCTVKSGLL